MRRLEQITFLFIRKGQIKKKLWVKFKTPLHVQSTCQTIVELCNIRDGWSFCDGLNYNNIICILNALSTIVVFVYM